MKFELICDPAAEEAVRATVHRPSDFTAKLENLVLQYNGADCLTAYGDEEIKRLPLSQVECICVLGGKTWAMAAGRQYELHHRLYALEAMLPSNFIRISKSALANRDNLDRFTVAFNGAVDAVFRSGCRELVSRRCFAEIKRRMEK